MTGRIDWVTFATEKSRSRFSFFSSTKTGRALCSPGRRCNGNGSLNDKLRTDRAGKTVLTDHVAIHIAQAEEHDLHSLTFRQRLVEGNGHVLGLRQELILLCRQCCNEWIRRLPGYRLKTNGYMLQLLHAILSEEMPDPTAPCRDKRILNLMTYILEHSDEKLQLQDFARELGLSPVYLGTRFKQVANENFSQYVMQCRLNRAEDLLSTGQYTALEVMLLCGFNDYSYFSRAFKRRFNIPPGQYRRQERELPIPPLPDGSDAREDR